jgi:predicted nucleic acid-binding protein
MAVVPLYLADKSAYGQRNHSDKAAERLDRDIAAGRIAVCEVVALELLYSARSAADYEALTVAVSALPWVPTTQDALRRALAVQHQLATRGHHRRPLPDLMIAATAELGGVTVLHYDHDFDLIAEVTGQPTEWIVPRGAGG